MQDILFISRGEKKEMKAAYRKIVSLFLCRYSRMM